MLGRLAHVMRLPVSRAWLATSSRSWRLLPRPTDHPSAHAPGSDPHRLLLIGGGIAVGYGMRTHELALAGQLARQISALTGRGATVDLIADPDLTARTALDALERVDLGRYAGVVLTLGGIEAFTWVPASVWRRDFERLLERLRRDRAPRALVAVSALELPVLTRGDRAVNRHVARLNAITRDLVQHADGSYVSVHSAITGGALTAVGRGAYGQWAATIAPAVVRRLPSGQVRTASWNEHRRQDAVERLTLSAVQPELERIAATARDLFGVRAASINVLDGEWQRTYAGAGRGFATPRNQALCELTIRQQGVFVVEDASTDPRVSHLAFPAAADVRFYAGHPVESPDGMPIGALCLLDPTPRSFGANDAALLRELALQVQSSLWQRARA